MVGAAHFRVPDLPTRRRGPKVDDGLLGPALARGLEPFLRTYYYNCLPYQSPCPTQEEKSRFAKAESFYYMLRKLKNFEVRLGRLAFRGVSKETGRPILEQKRVDVQMAVDLVTLACSRRIATAVLVTGDSDFIPAIQAEKDRGVRIVLFHGQMDSVHYELIAAAKLRFQFDQDLIDRVRLR